MICSYINQRQSLLLYTSKMKFFHYTINRYSNVCKIQYDICQFWFVAILTNDKVYFTWGHKLTVSFMFKLYCMDLKFGLSHWGKNIHWRHVKTCCWGEYLNLKRRGLKNTAYRGTSQHLFFTKFYWYDQIKDDERMGLVEHMGKMGTRTQIQMKNFSVKEFMRDIFINGRIALK